MQDRIVAQHELTLSMNMYFHVNIYAAENFQLQTDPAIAEQQLLQQVIHTHHYQAVQLIHPVLTVFIIIYSFLHIFCWPHDHLH